MPKKIQDGLTNDQRYYRRNREKARSAAATFKQRNPEAWKAHQKKWADANGDKIHAAFIKRRYGITKERYEAMVAEQNAKCAICSTDFAEFSKRPFVDHDHSTGKVRALLCGPCNVKVGYVETEGAWRSSVLAYIAKHKESELTP